jgi:hypothetical protein
VSDYDSPWKEALDLYFRHFMAFFFAWIYHDIDWDRGHEMLDKELKEIVPESEVGDQVVDKLVKVWRKDGREEWVLIHVEVQSQSQKDFPRRMFSYNCRIFLRYNREVVSLAVLGDDQSGWRPDRFEFDMWGFSLKLVFPVVKLLDYTGSVEALEKDDNPFAVVVLAHLKSIETRKDLESRRQWKFRLVRGLYERGWKGEEIRRLFIFIDWMMNLPPALDDLFRQDVFEYAEKQKMPYITSFEKLGRVKGMLEGIEAILDLRFGEAGLQLLPEIRRILDYEQMQKILQVCKSAESPDDIRPLLTPPADQQPPA